ncbi:MAG: hypothetical protein FD177_74 [Desulfovibrionaceae bacterium]|nr:MAG: hypothetical protein FD177_74 [Desulfovibrionaceae bacterium]
MAWNGLTILNALADGPRLTRQIAAALDKPSRDMSGCLGALRRQGLILSAEGVHEITEKGRAALAAGVELTSGPCNGDATSRHSRTLRVRAWRFMRMRDGFSLADMLRTLCDGTEAHAKDNLRSYIRALETAGYLQKLPRRGEAGQQRWRLKRDHDTGPEAPAWNKKARTLRDHNNGKAFAIPVKEASRAA